MPIWEGRFSLLEEDETMIIPIVEAPPTKPSQNLNNRKRWRLVMKPIRTKEIELAMRLPSKIDFGLKRWERDPQRVAVTAAQSGAMPIMAPTHRSVS
jgi:hypothetical protein